MSAAPTRRSVLTGSLVGAVGVLAGWLYGRHSDATTGSGGGASGYSTTATGKPIARLADVPVGGAVIVASAGVVLVRPSSGPVHALSSVCTHLGCQVDRVSGGNVLCPCHGSVFASSTGAVAQGPARSPLPDVPVVVRGGTVYRA